MSACDDEVAARYPQPHTHARLSLPLPAPLIPGHTAPMEQHQIQPTAPSGGHRLTDDEVQEFHVLLRKSGHPDFPGAHVRLTVARLLRLYRLCETAGQLPRPVSRIHSPVDNPLLPEKRR